MSSIIKFVCPCCAAEHTRGFLDGVSLFRCLACGYIGHGFHPDSETDRSLFLQHQEANAINRSLGVPEEHPFEQWEPGRSAIRHALGLPALLLLLLTLLVACGGAEFTGGEAERDASEFAAGGAIGGAPDVDGGWLPETSGGTAGAAGGASSTGGAPAPGGGGSATGGAPPAAGGAPAGGAPAAGGAPEPDAGPASGGATAAGGAAPGAGGAVEGCGPSITCPTDCSFGTCCHLDLETREPVGCGCLFLDHVTCI